MPRHPNPSDLPSDVSLDFIMTEENLWSVWYKPDRILELMGEGPIIQDWYLADSWKQITDISGFEMIAGINLKQLKEIYQAFKNKKSRFSWIPIFNKIYLVEKDNKQYWTVNKKRDEKVLFKGDIRDVKKLLDKGLDMYENGDYKKIMFDARPIQEGFPWDWRFFMIDPISAAHGRKSRELFEKGELFKCWPYQ